MDLARAVEYAVQAGRALIIPFIWLFSLTRLGATESGVDRRVISIAIVISTLVSDALGPAIAIPGFGSAMFACTITATA